MVLVTIKRAIKRSWQLQRKEHILRIWFTTLNKLKGRTPSQIRKFLIFLIALSACILTLAICYVCHEWHLQQIFHSQWQRVVDLKSLVSHCSVNIFKFLRQETTSDHNFSVWNAAYVSLYNKSYWTTWGNTHKNLNCYVVIVRTAQL